MRSLVGLAVAATLSSGAGSLAWGYAAGPPPNRAGLCGAPPTCQAAGCHENSLGVGNAVSTIELDGGNPLPATYRPGELFRFVISVVDPDPSRQFFGFQAAVISDCPFYQAAGTISVVEPARTQILAGGSIDYFEHSCSPPFDPPNCGYQPAVPGENAWTFDWQAPASSQGLVSIFWAINSADGSFDPLGDHVTLWQATIDAECPPRVEPLYAVEATCDPAEPAMAKVELLWDPAPGANGYRIYRTTDAAVLVDPLTLGADVVPGPCDDPAFAAVTHYTVAGLCLDLTDGPL